MKILYVAELVGKAGIYAYKKALGGVRKRRPWDFMIVCADGATGGGGLGLNHAGYIHKLGANVITLGDFCFYKKDLTANIEKMPFVLRPDNLNPDAPGFGARVFRAGSQKVAVAVLLGQSGFNRIHATSPFAALPALMERLGRETPHIIVDFHAQANGEKKTLFYAARGLCSAVIGSHTKVQTADEAVLPGGTAVISDAGRTGSIESVGGCEIESRINEYKSGIPDWTKDAWERPELQGVYLELDDSGKALSIERLRVPVDPAPETAGE
ncbi:MAG: YmdB family metallophosphoesterase [Spirochaetes bacterium]|nr:YmdB family metallophosphoesterase [Spirochaetota bacterium]